ncbi:MAG TPA: VacB/RNase II family 3'-5' exoribonuclease [Anaeromyxobacter sp.]|nr:VacB/RNase II family 3'-5' exoribonuclease [Anaeromyxobacter sp.]
MENEGRDRRRDALVEQLRRASGKPLSVRELMQRARLHPGERTEAKRALRELVREGAATKDGKRYAMPGAREAAPAGTLAPSRRDGRPPARARAGVLGTIKKHRDGFGFVARLDRKGDDVFVPPQEADKAVDGDLVRVEVVPARGGRTAGRVVEVVERRRRLLLGTYHARGHQSFVVPADPELAGYVPVAETRVAQDGEVVKVALDPGAGRLAGSVVEVVGKPGDPRVEVLKVAYAKGFADVFPDPVAAEARVVPDHVREEDRRGRRDLTHLQLVTIDGEDARDFDDAVHVERIEARAVPDHVRDEDRRGRRDLTRLPLVTIDGEDARDFDDAVHVERVTGARKQSLYRLVVAIADVAHYVRPGAALDDEAARRATSVYFPMQVLPMLPERLSNGICSLNPEVDRLCMVADLVVDGKGETRSAEVYEGVMRSAARCTYTEVARVLDGERVPGRERFREGFALMAELQAKLTAMRRRRGAIDFDLPEAKIVLGDDGQIVSIEKRPRNRAHRVVEEFMLAANEAVARWFGARDLPTIYRVHGVPDEEKLDAFLELARAHGFDVPDAPPDPRALNELLERFKGHAQQRALNQLLLRAMMQAVYSPENIGHYGLAAEHYLHFTSPIRRYPDLVVHRLLKEEWAQRRAQVQPDGGGPDRAGGPGRREPRASVPPARSADALRRTPGPRLVEMAALSSERERAAMEAEREIASFYAALFMKDRIGETFDGVVAAVVEFGLFVELERWFVEGLVRVEDLGEGFELDPVLHALVQPATGRSFRVGDRVRVEVVSSSPSRRRIELRLVEPEKPRVRREGAARAAPRGTGAPPRKPPRAERGPRPGRGKRGRGRS